MSAKRAKAAEESAKSCKRLQNELAQLNLNGDLYPNFTAGPTDDDNLYNWTGSIQGPPDSPYEGGVFLLDIEIPTTYPFSPPKVRFRTKIYHCNVAVQDAGRICLDILKEGWTPAYTIATMLLSITSLLTDPNPNSPLNGQAANLYVKNRTEHDRIAKEWTNLYAKPPPPPNNN